MKTPIFGVAVIAGIVALTLFFIISQESEVQSARMVSQVEVTAPNYRYNLQYSYNGKTWYDLIVIENGELSKNITYLRRGNKFPLLRYWYTYIDDEGERRAIAIPLTIDSPTEGKGRHV